MRASRVLKSIVGPLGATFLIGGYLPFPISSAAAATVRVLSPAPVHSVTAKAGSVLTAFPGPWDPGTVKRSCQWKAGGVVVLGATRSKLTLTRAMAGKTVTVTGTKAGYTTVRKTSRPTGAVVPAPARVFSPAPVPTISGEIAVGSTLTAVLGIWGPAPVALIYQWKAADAVIPDADLP